MRAHRERVIVDGHVEGGGFVPLRVEVLPVELALRWQLFVLVGAYTRTILSFFLAHSR